MEEKYKYEYVSKFPKRAVVTSGLPYGNKSLHCGHITLYIHSDFYARFLRDRIGKENVIYQSGTDCYGSPILEGYRKLVEAGKFNGPIEEYVGHYHQLQEDILKKYSISLDIFGASAFGEEKPVHEQVSREVFESLLKNGYLKNLSALQFYDTEKETFLNGRQVMGKCPIEGCSSEHAYADECDLGHQYMPQELIDPVSTLSGKTPELRRIGNWYFDLDNHIDLLKEWTEYLAKNTTTRKFAIKEINEFLKKPELYIKKEFLDDFNDVKGLPKHEVIVDNRPSFTVVFDKLTDREKACDILTSLGIRYRTGKTLVPFRLTGNISWGVPTPDTDELKGLTFWVWPESLWAQFSLTRAYLKRSDKEAEWKKWWASKDAIPYQFIGEDNIYFYGPAQTAIWLCLQGKNPSMDIKEGDLSIPQLVDNKHTLFLGKKASSSSAVKPPMADELLDYYSAEQLRMHLLSLNVGNNNASFMPKKFNPDAKFEDQDPVVREYNLLTNVYNRALRTLFYAWQNYFDGVVPYGEPDEEFVTEARKVANNVEKFMYEQKFHMVMYELDTYIRNINKYLSKNSKEMGTNMDLSKKVIINALYMCKVAMVLLHPMVPDSIEKLAKKLKLSSNIFSWENILCPIYDFVEDKEHYKPEYLEPKSDFFTIPECQRTF